MDDYSSRSQCYWTPQATRLLIRLRGDRESEFEQSGARKGQLWNDICEKLRDNGYDFSADRVSKKWHNIMITYQKNKSKKHGNINWEFYDDIEEVYRNKKMREIDLEADSYQYLPPNTLEHLEQNGVDLKPTKRKRTEQDDGYDSHRLVFNYNGELVSKLEHIIIHFFKDQNGE